LRNAIRLTSFSPSYMILCASRTLQVKRILVETVVVSNAFNWRGRVIG
jgi:hypothetical protein